MLDFFKYLQDCFTKNEPWKYILDGYLALIVIAFIVFLCIRYKKAVILGLIGIFVYAIYVICKYVPGLEISSILYTNIWNVYLFACIVILAPELRKFLDYKKKSKSTESTIIQTGNSTNEIADAVFKMASEKVGALISIELDQSLEQYADPSKAARINADISSELLEQIFVKNTPLHDGGVIIRGDKIITACAYYPLAEESEDIDKTTGARHRAAIGISQRSDCVTIVVSEETGAVDVTYGGTIFRCTQKDDLIRLIEKYTKEDIGDINEDSIQNN